MADFVLVHGGFHGGWCWSRVADILRGHGHRVWTPTLTGLGERSHLLAPGIDLTTHINDIVNVLRWESITDAVLCGHSYGGMVITGVADRARERVRRLIYLDAAVPEHGQSFLDLMGNGAAVIAQARAQGDGYRVPPISAEGFGIEQADDRAWVDSLTTAQPLATCTEPLSFQHAGGPTLPRTYIHALRARRRSGDIHAALVDRADWRTRTIDCGHEVMIDRPDELAAMLIEEAAA